MDEGSFISPPAPVPVIELVGVSRTYPGPPAVTALRRADLTVRRGEYVAVVGPSGSGKSTLLNLLGLVDRPTTGSYRLDGIDVAGLPERDRTALRGGRIGFVFQAFHLLDHRTALENVMLAQVYNGTPRSRRRAAASTALAQVGLGHRMHALPGTLSGGERQRVAVARALVNAPAILLCDEPTGNLDSETSGRLLDLVDTLHAAGLTIVVITHAADVAARAGRLLTMKDGDLTETPPAMRPSATTVPQARPTDSPLSAAQPADTPRPAALTAGHPQAALARGAAAGGTA